METPQQNEQPTNIDGESNDKVTPLIEHNLTLPHLTYYLQITASAPNFVNLGGKWHPIEDNYPLSVHILGMNLTPQTNALALAFVRIPLPSL